MSAPLPQASAGPAPLPGSRRRTLLILLTSLLLVLATAWWAWRWQQRRSALSLAASGDLVAAVPALERILARSPTDVEVLAILARGAVADGDADRARTLLDRWCRLRPDDPEPFRLRMKLSQKQQHLADELADVRHLLTLEPTAGLRFRAAQLAFATGEFAEADQFCRECLDEDPTWRAARRLHAQILQARGQHAQAAGVLDRLLTETPDDFGVLMARAVLHLDRGQPHLAIPLLEKVVRLDRTRQRTGRYQLALAYERAGRGSDAQQVMQEMRHLQEAEVLRDALNSQPDNPDVQLRAARAWLDGGNVSAALELLGKLLQRHPDHPGAHHALAEYYERVGQKDRAAEHRRRAAGSRSK